LASFCGLRFILEAAATGKKKNAEKQEPLGSVQRKAINGVGILGHARFLRGPDLLPKEDYIGPANSSPDQLPLPK